MKTIILDSSVFAKWFFPEEGNEKALELKVLFNNRVISIVVPVLVYYEITNLLKTAVKVSRLEEKEAINVAKPFMKLNLVSYASSELFQSALDLAIKYDISAYDASYVALSEELKVPFITADKKLVRKVKNKLIYDLESINIEPLVV